VSELVHYSTISFRWEEVPLQLKIRCGSGQLPALYLQRHSIDTVT
jgi:hypothetical protein